METELKRELTGLFSEFFLLIEDILSIPAEEGLSTESEDNQGDNTTTTTVLTNSEVTPVTDNYSNLLPETIDELEALLNSIENDRNS